MKRFFSFPVKLFLWLIGHPRVTVGIGVLFFVSLIWAAGPLIGLESREIRLYLTISIFVLWIVFVMVDQYRADRGAKLLEESLRKQAQDQLLSARPDHKEKIEALGNEFEKAISSLKQSRLGKGRKGISALYALPWYMFIGPPASGKSTALLHSGLQFPSLGGSGKGIQGVGGTRNCDWWFTSESVLLDTAGRYVTEEEDREEWFGFLSLLKKYRKEKPINGVLAAISVTDLVQASEEEIESHAKNIRARIDELMQQLGIVFPVYLLFTKCDLLQGFVEFFEDLGKGEREQIWGATFPRKFGSAEQPHLLFDSEFRLLCQSLQAHRISRLSSARGSKKIRDIYSFPLQLASCRENFIRFVEILFQPNPYKENPVFRGFYLTSGTQEGTPVDRILSKISRASGLPDLISESFEVQKESKSYFIKNLFTDVIFPDQILAGSSSSMARQRGYMRIGIFVGGVFIVSLLCVGLFFSFAGNEHLIASAESAAQKASQISADDERQFEYNVQTLDRVLVRLKQLRTYEKEGPPLRLRLGLYRGSTLYPPLRDLYFDKFRNLFMVPAKNVIELELGDFIANPKNIPASRDSDYYYSLLKAYLMMADPGRREPQFLDRLLDKLWGSYLIAHYGEKHIPAGLQEAAFRQIRFYSLQSAEERVPLLLSNQRLVKDSQRVLQEVPVTERIYNRIKREAGEGLEPFTVDSLFQAKRQDLLVSTYQVSGLYTEKGWKSGFKDSMARILSESGEEGWVLGVPELKRGDLEGAVEKLYFNDYTIEWQKFLESVRIKPEETLPDISRQVEILAKEDSPVKTFLTEVVRETDFGARSQGAGMAASLVQKVKKELKLDSGQGDFTDHNSNPVSMRFRSLGEFVLPEDSKKPSGLSQYFGEINKVHDSLTALGQSDPKTVAQTLATGGSNEIVQSFKNTDKLLQQLDPDARKAVSPLLLQPFRMIFAGVMKKAEDDLNVRWRKEVYEPCVQSVGGRYPFKPGGEDAALNDVADFFHPQNGILWKFYEKELKPYIDSERESWEVRKGMDVGIQISPEFLDNLKKASQISESLFPRGNPDLLVPFELYPYPSPGMSEILINVSGKDFRYRNEPQEWHELSWPGNSDSTGAMLQVNAGGMRQGYQYPGRWGFFKMLDAGKVMPVNPTRYQLEWNLKIQESKILKIRFDLRAQSFKNPFKPGLFTDFRCLEKL